MSHWFLPPSPGRRGAGVGGEGESCISCLPKLSLPLSLLSDSHLPDTVQEAGNPMGAETKAWPSPPGPSSRVRGRHIKSRHGSCEERCKEELRGGLRGCSDRSMRLIGVFPRK